MKSFYNILEANNHWFAIYHNYIINNFGIIKSIYNLYLFYKYDLFGIIYLQTNDILILTNNILATIEKKAIEMAKFIAKKQACFLFKILIKFNSI